MEKVLKILNILCFILLSFNSLFAQNLLETPFRNRSNRNQQLFALNKIKTVYLCSEIQVSGNDEKSIKLDTTEIHHYDKKGQLIEIKRFYRGGFRRIVSEYDSIGRRTKEAVYDGSSRIPMGSVTIWKYNTKDNLVEQHNGSRYKRVIPRNKPNEEHYFEDANLKRVTKMSVDGTGSVYTVKEFDQTNALINHTIYELDSEQRLSKMKSMINSEYPTTTSYLYDKNGREIENIYEQNFAGEGGFKKKFELNEQGLRLRLRQYDLNDKFLQSAVYLYEHY
ncbi:hypothetical protein R9C00_07885 [Flammeovirgaceae bacterium SG7u.111]|nr:hypothetical protein [Flammeovirgaceae bacterium SG7u.132]WPO37367.1 hypothetical protein R9C00_07885 [Flammeovirgaceae bacterium SG7u.111]